MNEFKNGSMLTKIVQSHPESAQPVSSPHGTPQPGTPQAKQAPPLETDLGALAEHLAVIADALRKSTGDANPHHASSVQQQSEPAPRNGDTPSAVYADARMRRKMFGDMAREAYAVRRRRGAIFNNEELFGEPAWDILLDLYVADVENKPVSVSSACIGSAAPPTTGLRWLGVLSEEGLIAREHDPEDQRRVLVRLTDKGLAAMDEYFASLGLNP